MQKPKLEIGPKVNGSEHIAKTCRNITTSKQNHGKGDLAISSEIAKGEPNSRFGLIVKKQS